MASPEPFRFNFGAAPAADDAMDDGSGDDDEIEAAALAAPPPSQEAPPERPIARRPPKPTVLVPPPAHVGGKPGAAIELDRVELPELGTVRLYRRNGTLLSRLLATGVAGANQGCRTTAGRLVNSARH